MSSQYRKILADGIAPPTGEPPTAAEPGQAARLPLIDIMRGVALAAMIVYHTAWDLAFLNLAPVDPVGNPAWRMFAHAIAASFLAIVGVSLVLAGRGGVKPKAFLRRLAIITAAALAVTVATYFAMPGRFIFFGILHAIALFSILALPFLKAPIWLLAGAATLVALAPTRFAHPAFDAPALRWIGLGPTLPSTNDYVPLFPWFAAVLAGIALARIAATTGVGRRIASIAPSSNMARLLALGGRHSLAIYLAHQPILIGALWLVLQATGPNVAAERAPVMRTCIESCRDSGGGNCRTACRCAVEAVKQEGLWRGVLDNNLTSLERTTVGALVRDCRERA